MVEIFKEYPEAENVWEDSETPLSDEERTYAEEIANTATNSDNNVVRTEEDKARLWRDFDDIERSRREQEVKDYIFEGISNGAIKAGEQTPLLNNFLKGYAYSGTIEEVAAMNELEQYYQDILDAGVDPELIDQRRIADRRNAEVDWMLGACLQEKWADAKKHYEEQSTPKQFFYGLRHIFTPLESWLKNRWAPKDQPSAYLPSSIIDESKKYWKEKAQTLTPAEFSKELDDFYQYLKDKNVPWGAIEEYFSDLVNRRSKIGENIADAFAVLDVVAAPATFALKTVKGVKAGLTLASAAHEGITSALPWTVPLATTAYKGTVGLTRLVRGVPVFKNDTVLGLSKAEKLKQEGKIEEAAEESKISSSKAEQLSESAPVTRANNNIDKGSDLAGATTFRNDEVVKGLYNTMRATEGLKASWGQSLQEFFDKEYVKNFIKSTTFSAKAASLRTLFEDGSGGYVLLNNNGRWWKSQEEAEAAMQKLFQTEKVSKTGKHNGGIIKKEATPEEKKALGFFEKGVTPVRIDEKKQRYGIMVPLKTPESLMNYHPTALKSFPTEEAANKAIKKERLTEFAKVEKRNEGDYIVIPTSDKKLPASLIGGSETFTKGFVKNYLSALGTKIGWTSLAQATIRDAGKFDSTLRQYADKYFKPLSRAENKELDRHVKSSIKNRAYFSNEDLEQMGASTKVIEAYNALINVNDVMYLINSSFDRASRVAAGQFTVKIFGEAQGFGKRIDTKRISNPSLYDWSVYKGDQFIDINGGTTASKKLLKDYPPSQYDYIISDLPLNGAKSRYSIVPKNVLTFTELPQFPSRYVPGFRNLYGDDTVFIKMSMPIRNDVGDIEDIGSIVTIAGSRSAQNAARYVEDANIAFEAVCKNDATILQNLKQYFKGEDLAGLKQMFTDMKIPTGPRFIDNKFEALKNGERPKALNAAKVAVKEYGEELDRFTQSSVRGLNETEANLKARKRDLGLLDVDGGPLDSVDVNELMTTMINNIVNTVGIKEYQRIAGQDFVKTFGHLLDENEVASMSPYQLLLFGTLKDGEGYRAAQAAQSQARVICGVPTKLDIAINKAWNHFKDDVLDQYVPGWKGSKLDVLLTDAPIKTVTAARTATFQFILGCWNPAPFFQNVLSTSLAISLSPRAGLKALPYTMKMSAMIGRDMREDAFKFWSKEEKEIWDNIDMLPIHNQPQDYSGYAADILQKFKNAQNWLATPFNIGEKFVRTHAAITTFLEAKAKNPNIDFRKISASELSYYTDRMNTLYNRMSRASVAPVQRGVIGSITFQMLGYQMRVFDNLFSKKLTGMEKARMLGFAMFLTGAEGVVGKDVWSNIYSRMYTDSDQEPDEMFQVLSDGIPTYMMHALTGSNLDLTSPIDLNLGEITKPLVNLVSPEMSPLGTKTVGAAKTLIDAVNIVNYLLYSDTAFLDTFEVGTDLLYQSMKQNQLLPAVWSKAERALATAQTGKFQALSGKTLATGISGLDAAGYFFLGAGIQPAEIASMYRGILSDENKKIQTITNLVAPSFEDFAAEPTSVEKYKRWLANYHLMTIGLSGADREKVLDAVTKVAKISLNDLKIQLLDKYIQPRRDY